MRSISTLILLILLSSCRGHLTDAQIAQQWNAKAVDTFFNLDNDMLKVMDSCQAMLDSALVYDDDPFFYSQKAAFYAQVRDFSSALPLAVRATQGSEYPDYITIAGMMFDKLGEKDSAMHYYSKAIDIYSKSPLNDKTIPSYALTLALSGDRDRAYQLLSRMKDTERSVRLRENLRSDVLEGFL